MKISIGSDPEFFLSLDGKFISASGLFPGTKKEPFKLDKGAVQVDGLALEFNIDPAETEDEFETNMSVVLVQIREMMDRVDPSLKMNFIPFAEFDPSYFKELDDDCKILGCDPDYNVDGLANPVPEIFNMPIRTAAGHIHIGWSKDENVESSAHRSDCQSVARHFLHSFPAKTQLETKRIDYYGRPGAHRPKPYGVELRNPSNLWVENEKSRRNMYSSVYRHMMNFINHHS